MDQVTTPPSPLGPGHNTSFPSPLGPGYNTSLPPSPPGPGHNTSLPPPGTMRRQAVHILLECILVLMHFHVVYCELYMNPATI